MKTKTPMETLNHLASARRQRALDRYARMAANVDERNHRRFDVAVFSLLGLAAVALVAIGLAMHFAPVLP